MALGNFGKLGQLTKNIVFVCQNFKDVYQTSVHVQAQQNKDGKLNHDRMVEMTE
jgi:hypothetical protein